MSTEFRYEHVFRAASPEVVLAAYFDPDHLATQDAQAELEGRVVIADEDSATTRTTSWRVQSKAQLPVFVRPFVAGGRLSYVEAMIWRKADNAIDLVVTPQILKGRVTVNATYTLSQAGVGEVRRIYSGTINVGIPLIGRKVETGVHEQFDKAMPVMTDCTQQWLLKHRPI